MKNLKSLILPAAIVLIGAGAALATNVAKNSDSNSQPGYYIDSSTGECRQSPEMCSTTPGDLCTWDDGSSIHSLFEADTECTVSLFKPAN